MPKNLRYPGPTAFSEAQAPVFMGREDDVERLRGTLLRLKQVMVHARSGVGKSSLVNAGLIPVLRAAGWRIVMVRFKAFEEARLSPVQLLRAELQSHGITLQKSYLDRFLPPGDELWPLLKSRQTPEDKPLLIVFDQMEELFTLGEDMLRDWKQQMSDLLNPDVPSRFLAALRRAEEGNPDVLSDPEYDLLFSPPPIHVVCTIREDALHHTLRIRDALPDLQQNLFELKALSKEQAKAAIQRPAADPLPHFATAPFTVTDADASEIIDYLTEGGEVVPESTVLQIICQKLEETAKDGHVSLASLRPFEEVVKRFYIESVEGTSNPAATKRFIEERMILRERRFPVSEVDCLRGLGLPNLRLLVDKHLLRAVQFGRDERSKQPFIYYELCHDNFIQPVMEQKKAREEAEAAAEAERLEAQRREEDARLIREKEEEAEQLKQDLAAKEAEEARKRRQLRRSRLLSGLALASALTAFYFRIEATKAKHLAEREKQNAYDAALFLAAEKARTDSLYKLLANQTIENLWEKYQVITDLDQEAARVLVDSMHKIDSTNHLTQQALERQHAHQLLQQKQ